MKKAKVIDDDNETMVISQLLNAYHRMFKEKPDKFTSRVKASRRPIRPKKRTEKNKATEDSGEACIVT